MRTQDLLPATATEIAVICGITTRQANARLQDLAVRGVAVRSNRAVPPIDRHVGRWPHIWELIA